MTSKETQALQLAALATEAFRKVQTYITLPTGGQLDRTEALRLATEMAPNSLSVLSASLEQLGYITMHGIELSRFESAETMIELSRREVSVHPDSIPLRRIAASAWIKMADTVCSTAPQVRRRPRLWARLPSEELCLRESLRYLDTKEGRQRMMRFVKPHRGFVEAYPGRQYRVDEDYDYGWTPPALVRCPCSNILVQDNSDLLP